MIFSGIFSSIHSENEPTLIPGKFYLEKAWKEANNHKRRQTTRLVVVAKDGKTMLRCFLAFISCFFSKSFEENVTNVTGFLPWYPWPASRDGDRTRTAKSYMDKERKASAETSQTALSIEQWPFQRSVRLAGFGVFGLVFSILHTGQFTSLPFIMKLISNNKNSIPWGWESHQILQDLMHGEELTTHR